MICIKISVALTTMFYAVASYMSYMSSFILFTGINYRLISPVAKSLSFILLCYISIISDVMLFTASMYTFVIAKNGVLFTLAVSSLLFARLGKEKKDE